MALKRRRMDAPSVMTRIRIAPPPRFAGEEGTVPFPVPLRRRGRTSAKSTLCRHPFGTHHSPMRPPEEFHTHRLRLRPVALTDAADIFRYASEPAPTRFMTFERHRDIAESVAFAERCEDCWTSGSAFQWAVIETASGRLAGVLELRLSPPKADFGYILGEPFWGHGFASEAASAMVAWAIDQTEIFRVWATCHPDNAASAAVLRKAGLSYEATLGNWESRPQLGEFAGPSDFYALTKPTR